VGHSLVVYADRGKYLEPLVVELLFSVFLYYVASDGLRKIRHKVERPRNLTPYYQDLLFGYLEL
jgi:hypothetical protein